MNKSLLLLSVLLSASATLAQPAFRNWPKGSSPEEVGKKVTERFVLSPHGKYGSGATPHIPYFEVCTWYGALQFAEKAKNKELINKLTERFAPLLNIEAALLPVPDHVDYNVFGSIPFELYKHSKDEMLFNMGKMYADTQWGQPAGSRVTSKSYEWQQKGYSRQTRLWIDDMYMITLVQAQAYRATGDTTYINRAAREMVLYLDSLQKPNGLFFHAPASPFYWGRGNGWMAAGMAELLKALPKNNPDRTRIMNGYKTMMASLLKFQADDGMWRQLIDDSESWKETSSTGMFAFAMITGVKMGWLDKKSYTKAARKAWLALTKYIDNNADVTEICEGTGAGNNRQYYLDRKRKTGDFHGQAPILWCAAALLK